MDARGTEIRPSHRDFLEHGAILIRSLGDGSVLQPCYGRDSLQHQPRSGGKSENALSRACKFRRYHVGLYAIVCANVPGRREIYASNASTHSAFSFLRRNTGHADCGSSAGPLSTSAGLEHIRPDRDDGGHHFRTDRPFNFGKIFGVASGTRDARDRRFCCEWNWRNFAGKRARRNCHRGAKC